MRKAGSNEFKYITYSYIIPLCVYVCVCVCVCVCVYGFSERVNFYVFMYVFILLSRILPASGMM